MRAIRIERLVVAALACGLAAIAILGSVATANEADKKPNILIIWGDDIGYWNVSAYNQGMMGYKTPNIDRIAKEGALFTDWYGQQSCTAGRAALITGQVGFRDVRAWPAAILPTRHSHQRRTAL
jgi:arylsulfatase A-like enzyme